MGFLFSEMNVGAIKFFVEGPPVAQPRHRDTVIFPKSGDGTSGSCPGCGRGYFIHKYLPKDHPIHTFKEHCRIMARHTYKGEPLKGPLRVTMLILLRRPTSLPKKTPGRVWAPHKPDRDNVEKAVFDSLKGIVWVDDAQVCDGHTRKMYAAIDEKPGVEIMIEEIE